MPIAIYARKSTESEDRQVQSLDDQVKALQALANRENFVVSEIFTESHSAKSPGTRPEFRRLMDMVEAGQIDGILTWAINRLSRNDLDGGLIAHLLHTGKLKFIKTTERTYRPDDNALLMSIENGMAVAFIQDLKRNVIRGMKGKVDRGWHASKAPIGYKNEPETREIVPDPVRFALVREAWDLMLSDPVSVAEVHRQMVERGLTSRSRNKTTGPISRAKMHTLFRERFYLGEILFKGETYPGRHMPMVTEDEFMAVQTTIARLGRGPKPKRNSLAFTGALRCSECGCQVVGEVKTKHYPKTERTVKYTYYHCSGSKGCSKKAIDEETLRKAVEPYLLNFRITTGTARWLKKALVESVERGASTTFVSLLDLEKKREDKEVRLRRLTNLRLDHEISADEYAALRSDLMNEQEDLRYQAAKARNSASMILGQIYKRIDAAVQFGELRGGPNDCFALGQALRIAGDHLLNLLTFEFRIDSILANFITFEPLRNGYESLEYDDFVPMNSLWWRLVENLLTSATGLIAEESRKNATKAQLGQESRRKDKRKQLIDEYERELIYRK